MPSYGHRRFRASNPAPAPQVTVVAVICCASGPGAILPRRAQPARLTPQQTAVLRTWLEFKNLDDASRHLGINPHTASGHKRTAMLRLGIDNDIDLVRYCIRVGWLAL